METNKSMKQFLQDNPLADAIADEWYNNEILACAILYALERRNIINHLEVMSIFDELAGKKLFRKIRLEDIADTNDD